MSRISRDQMFMEIAQTVARRGTCDRAQVGAVLVDDEAKNIVAIGYNGSPTGMPHCDDVGHLIEDSHCTRAIHAEVNCLRKAGKYFGADVPLTLYVTHYPCMNCTLDLVKAKLKGLNIHRILYLLSYRTDDEPMVREKLFEAGGIKVEQYMGESGQSDKES